MAGVFTPFQKIVFDNLSNQNFITKNFWFSGGTALAEFYLQHRYSEDLDFFTDQEISIEEIRARIYPVFKEIGIESVEYRELLSSKIFFIKRGEKEKVKVDFNFFPYQKFGKEKIFKNIRVDSLLDIAISKLDTLLTRNKARDFIDFYFIAKNQTGLIKKENPFNIESLLEKLEKRAMWKIDRLQLAASFSKIKKLYDYPKMIKEFSKQEMINYFLSLAASQKSKIVK